MNDQSESVKALESRVAILRREMDDILAAARRRTNTMRVVLFILIVGMAIYFTFIYNKLATVDAELVAAYAHSQVSAYIDDGGKKLTQQAKDNAPALFDTAEEYVLKQPKVLSRRLRTELEKRVDEELPKLEEQMTNDLKALVNTLADKASEANGGKPMGKEEFKVFVDDLAVQTSDEIIALIDQIHARYKENADPVIAYLEKLATASPEVLSAREKHHRDLVIDTLSLLQKHMMEPDSAGEGNLPPAPAGPTVVPVAEQKPAS